MIRRCSMGLAKAQFLSGDGAGAQASLDALQIADPNFSSGDAHMIYARALELQGKDQEALEEYRKLARYFAGEEARARYAMMLQKLGATDEARTVFSGDRQIPRRRAAPLSPGAEGMGRYCARGAEIKRYFSAPCRKLK
jgi:hypothetical protein